VKSNERILALDKALLKSTITKFCKKDLRIKDIVAEIGLPDLHYRKQGFETLVKIILGQQVSLASALSAYLKLKEKKGRITPKSILNLTEEELRQCYFSRQKIIYVRALSTAILEKKVNLNQMAILDDDEVIKQLTQIKGIGIWTAEVYLLQALRRTNIFPLGDLAAINALKEIFEISDKSLLEKEIEKYSPSKTSLLFLAWHYYLKKRNLKIIL
jgi:DNA-3-methyladenine glycosylase II